MTSLHFKAVLLAVSLLAIWAFAGYNEQIARDLVPVSGIAYWGESKILKEDCADATKLIKRAGFKVLEAVDNRDEYSPITVVILKNDKDKQIVVSFSGTKTDIQLFSQGLQMGPVPYATHPIDGAQVAKFFYEQYNVHFKTFLRAKLQEILKQYPSYSIYFTGHSLGGALATHAAADMILSRISGTREVYLYTFGQPRVANKYWFKGWFDKLSGAYRIVHNEDIVPHLPNCIPSLSGGCSDDGILPFYPFHVIQEIYYIDFSSGYKSCDLTGEDESCSNGGRKLSVDDHNSYFDLPINTLWETSAQPNLVEYLLKK